MKSGVRQKEGKGEVSIKKKAKLSNRSGFDKVLKKSRVTPLLFHSIWQKRLKFSENAVENNFCQKKSRKPFSMSLTNLFA